MINRQILEKLALFFLLSAPLMAQEPFLTKTNLTLFSADFLVRTLDAQSTRRAITAPCHCNKEDFIPSIASSTPKLYAYSLGIASVNVLAAYELHRLHHDKFAKVFYAVEISYESESVVSNYLLRTR